MSRVQKMWGRGPRSLLLGWALGGCAKPSCVPVRVKIQNFSSFPDNLVLLLPCVFCQGRSMCVNFQYGPSVLLYCAHKGAARLSHMRLCAILARNPIYYSIPLIQCDRILQLDQELAENLVWSECHTDLKLSQNPFDGFR